MKHKLYALMLLAAAFSLSGCSGPSYLVIVNAMDQAITITYASNDREDFNHANGSPWFWPWRTDPTLRSGASYKATTYCYSCRGGWRVKFHVVAGCDLDFAAPGAPETYPQPPEWNVFLAYRDDAVQLGADMRLYRIPAYGGEAADVRLIPQPTGYPVAAAPGGCAPTE